MENQDENDRVVFEGRLKNVRVYALNEASHSVEDLIVIYLQEKERMGRISSRIKQVTGFINALKRHIYFQYRNNPEILFDYFKRNGILHNPQEWSLLEQALILDYKRYFLEVLLLENCSLGNIPLPELLNHYFDDRAYAGLRDNDRETLTLHRQLILPSNDPASTPGNYTETPFIDRSLSPERLLAGLNAANDKYHILAPQTPVMVLYRKIICPNWANNREEVHLDNKTNLFSWLANCIKNTYKHFTYAHIGHSCLFFSKNEILLTESALSSAILKNKEKKQCIASFFK